MYIVYVYFSGLSFAKILFFSSRAGQNAIRQLDAGQYGLPIDSGVRKCLHRLM